jgi:hypothetical protein
VWDTNNTDNIRKAWALLQTTSAEDELNIGLYAEFVADVISMYYMAKTKHLTL